MYRRSFLKSALMLSAASAAVGAPRWMEAQALPLTSAPAKSGPKDFDFVFFTDTHTEPELKGDIGTAKCFDQVNHANADFCIAGGDQVFDVCEQDLNRAHLLFKLYQQVEKDHLHGKIYYTVGNHDVIGINQKSPVEPGDLEYGKKLYQDYFGPRYHSFDHKGWHFIILDSIGIEYYKKFNASFDDEQLAWLKSDLDKVPATTPIIVVSHVPIATVLGTIGHHQPHGAGPICSNSYAIHAALAGHNLKAILQGHLHVWQKSEYQGVQYLISGAVSGAWWEGPMHGTPEGYTLCQIRGGELYLTYVTYPWNAVVIHKDA